MRFRTEHEFNRWFSDALRSKGALVIAMVASGFQQSGLPDRYVAHARWTGWLEGKKDSGQPSTGQRVVIRQLRERRVQAYVIKYCGDVDAVRLMDERGNSVVEGRPWENPGEDLLKMLEEAQSYE